MSKIITNEIYGRKEGNYVVGVNSGTTVYFPGHVIQTVWRRFENHTTYNAPPDTVRTINGLDLNIQLKKANSAVYLQWYIFYEAHHDITFQALRNTTIIGYNLEAGLQRWSGIGSAEYEHSHNQDSTPSYQLLTYMDEPAAVGPYVYRLGIRSSTSTNYDFRINRSWSSFSDSYEAGVSWVVAEEIAK
jgi:hypothetical protein